ncbi:MAG: DUF6597 domain-containing transcriptional factor [Bacteroidota bacterium]
MSFHRIQPDTSLSHLVECYWIVKDDDNTVRKQKIIPDGFTEIIFHLADPYRIQLSGSWEIQERNLLAGQINKYFFLENTGVSHIIGIKLKPTALAHLFNLNMHEYSNRVADIHTIKAIDMDNLEKSLRSSSLLEEQVNFINDYFKKSAARLQCNSLPADRAVNLIFEKHGMLSIVETCKAAGVGERQLENVFKKYIGLSPKLLQELSASVTFFNCRKRMIRTGPGWLMKPLIMINRILSGILKPLPAKVRRLTCLMKRIWLIFL